MNNLMTLLTALCVPLDRFKEIDDPAMKFGLPIVLVGPPGIGKSEFVEQAGEALNLFVHTVFPAGMNPEDVKGLPVQDGRGDLRRTTDDAGVKMLAEIAEGILFLDEMNTNRVNMQAALLSVTLRREYGGIKLPPRCRIVAAMNPPECSAGGIPLTLPMANRYCHVPFNPHTKREWCDWHMGYAQDAKITLYDAHKKLEENWNDMAAKVRGTITGFMESGASVLYDMPQPGSPEASSAWTSERTWFWASQAIITSRILEAGVEVENTLVEGCVGEAQATALYAYLKDANLPSPEEMLKNGWDPDVIRLDRSMAAYESLCAFVSGKPDTTERTLMGVKTWKMLKQACDAGLADLIYKPAVSLVNRGLGISRDPKLPENADLAAAVKPVLDRFYNYNDLLTGKKR